MPAAEIPVYVALAVLGLIFLIPVIRRNWKGEHSAHDLKILIVGGVMIAFPVIQTVGWGPFGITKEKPFENQTEVEAVREEIEYAKKVGEEKIKELNSDNSNLPWLSDLETTKSLFAAYGFRREQKFTRWMKPIKDKNGKDISSNKLHFPKIGDILEVNVKTHLHIRDSYKERKYGIFGDMVVGTEIGKMGNGQKIKVTGVRKIWESTSYGRREFWWIKFEESK